MEKTILTAGIVLVPIILLLLIYKLMGRKVDSPPLIWAGFAFAVYFLLLRSESVIPGPSFMDGLSLNWFGKTLTIMATILMLRFLPRVSYRQAGVTFKQNKGSLIPVTITAVITLLITTGTALLVSATPDTSLENLLFQATMPGLDEELFMRGLVLLLFTQAFGKGLRIFGANTGWGFWLVVGIFGLLHGVTIQEDGISVNGWLVLATGYMGFILTWMRERTGSLVAPIVFHNLVNLTLAFV